MEASTHELVQDHKGEHLIKVGSDKYQRAQKVHALTISYLRYVLAEGDKNVVERVLTICRGLLQLNYIIGDKSAWYVEL